MKARLILGAATTFVAFAVAQPAAAQQLNQRRDAPPEASSKVQQVVARAELQSRQSGGGGLKDDKLTVTRSCGAVQVGGTQAGTDRARPTSLVPSQTLVNKDNATVVKNVVNICR